MMDLTFFSDLHGNFQQLDKLNGKENLFFLGDMFTSLRYVELLGQEGLHYYYKILTAEQFYKMFLAVKSDLEKIRTNHELPEFFKNNKVFMVPGNHDTQDFYERIIQNNNLINLHLRKEIIDGVEVIGHGGMFVPKEEMDFPHFYMYSDRKIAENIAALNPSEGCILVMHELPIKDYCKETRKVIERIKPRLVVGGHDHSLSEVDLQINGIRYVCAGIWGNVANLNITSD
jgi:Icc-related predicted phosphoesterase